MSRPWCSSVGYIGVIIIIVIIVAAVDGTRHVGFEEEGIPALRWPDPCCKLGQDSHNLVQARPGCKKKHKYQESNEHVSSITVQP